VPAPRQQSHRNLNSLQRPRTEGIILLCGALFCLSFLSVYLRVNVFIRCCASRFRCLAKAFFSSQSDLEPEESPRGSHDGGISGTARLPAPPIPQKKRSHAVLRWEKACFFPRLFSLFPASLQRDFRERDSLAFLHGGRTKGDGAHLACSCAPSRFSSCAFWLKFSRKWRKSCSGMGFA